MFDEEGHAAHWSPTSKKTTQKAYGLWLAYLLRAGKLDPGEPPAARASQNNLQAYLHTFRGNKPTSTANRLRDMYEALRVMCPRADLDPLRRLVRRLQAVARKQERVRPNMVSTDELYTAGLARMTRIAQTAYEKRDVKAVRFGDGLLMAMLACKPIRLRNIIETRVGVNLARVGDIYVLQFAPADTKNGQPIRAQLPGSLTPFIDDWLTKYRPVLLRGRASDALWISSYRQPMAAATLTARFYMATEQELGVRMSPHRVRHCLATSVALGLPEKARMLPPLLDHKSDATARKYYVMADKLATSEVYLTMLERRRRQVGED